MSLGTREDKRFARYDAEKGKGKLEKTEGEIELPKGVAKGHDSVGDELQLILEHRVLFRQTLFGRAGFLVLLIVRGYGCVRVSTFKVVFPEF
mgnify:CR=1 FL=1